MLNLYANLFSRAGDTRSDLPRSLINEAIERTVDGTDPRLRIMSGYAKTLRKPVIHAAECVIDLIESLPAPVLAGKRALADDPAFAALFYSEANMNQILNRDAALSEFRAASPQVADTFTALLVAQRTEKQGFGHAQVGDQVLSDVPRTTVSFGQHRLLAPAVGEQETRRLLKHRAFDHLLSIALAHVIERKEERDTLGKRKALLRSKLGILQRGASFSQHTGAVDQASLQASLEDIEQRLAALGSTEEVLPGILTVVADVLSKAESHFWLQDKALCLDKFYVLHDKPGPSAPRTVFRELHDSEDRQVTLLLINLPPQ
jgi:hypothetical protein